MPNQKTNDKPKIVVPYTPVTAMAYETMLKVAIRMYQEQSAGGESMQLNQEEGKS